MKIDNIYKNNNKNKSFPQKHKQKQIQIVSTKKTNVKNTNYQKQFVVSGVKKTIKPYS